jgi:hypothetical protein
VRCICDTLAVWENIDLMKWMLVNKIPTNIIMLELEFQIYTFVYNISSERQNELGV